MYLVRYDLPVMYTMLVSLLMCTCVNSCLRILIGVHEVQIMKSMGTFVCYHQYYGMICTNLYLDEFLLCVPCDKSCP
jgi:hypothetical protein